MATAAEAIGDRGCYGCLTTTVAAEARSGVAAAGSGPPWRLRRSAQGGDIGSGGVGDCGRRQQAWRSRRPRRRWQAQRQRTKEWRLASGVGGQHGEGDSADSRQGEGGMAGSCAMRGDEAGGRGARRRSQGTSRTAGARGPPQR